MTMKIECDFICNYEGINVIAIFSNKKFSGLLTYET